MAKKRIIGVIGLGHVGAHVAYSLAVQGIADELVLVDQEKQKLASEVQDLRDAAAYPSASSTSAIPAAMRRACRPQPRIPHRNFRIVCPPHPLTAPAVMPETRYFCAKKPTSMIGRNEMHATAPTRA